MPEEFEVRWEGEVPGTPDQVWDAITVHSGGWLWTIDYEPWAGGAERGLTSVGGTVTGWEPNRRFTTRARDEAGLNELDYLLEPRGTGTYVRYTHRGAVAGNYEQEVDACRRHTAFYRHSMSEYVRHFAGRDAAYVAADAPEESTKDGFATVRRALGLPERVSVGDRVRLTPAGLDPIEGVVDYATAEFLGVRTADSLFRCYGRDTWGWPIGVAQHVFADDVDVAAREKSWQAWLDDLFRTNREAVA